MNGAFHAPPLTVPPVFAKEYIRNQLQEDYTDDQMSIKEYVDPFTGQPITEGK